MKDAAILLFVTPFIGLFITMSIIVSILDAVLAFSVAITIAMMVFGSAYLISEAISRDKRRHSN